MNRCPECGEVYEGAELFCPKDGSRLDGADAKTRKSIPPEQDPLVGKVIQGRYRVIEKLGEGGMGVVYTAEHVEIEKIVALKVLRDDFSKRPEVVERFRQEAKAASRIGHPNIVDVTDFGQLEDGGVYFVMEFLKGRGLSDLIVSAPIALDSAVSIILQISRALDAAHKLGIVHRDLKPENIFLIERDGRDDFVKILDFGIAKISDRDSDGKRLTKTGMIFGTPEYMSPEQAAGKQLDHRVDIYALGCIMFEMFTGRVPFDGESFMAVLTQHMFEPVPLIETVVPDTQIPESVRSVVYKAMAKETEERYPDMTALMEDLKRAVADSGYIVDSAERNAALKISQEMRAGAAPATGSAHRTELDWTESSERVVREGRQRGRRVFAAVAIALLMVGVAAAVLGLVRGEKEPPPPAQSLAALRAPEPPRVEPPSAEKATATAPAGGPVDSGDAKGGAPAATPAAETEPEKIDVSVRSEPEGAVVMIEGLGQVCSKAPCNVALEPGKPVQIEARVDKQTAAMTFTPSPENREVVLKIEMPAPEKKDAKPRHRPRPAPERKPPAESAKKSSELKIPGIFKDR